VGVCPDTPVILTTPYHLNPARSAN
jgi:hypothetical protein